MAPPSAVSSSNINLPCERFPWTLKGLTHEGMNLEDSSYILRASFEALVGATCSTHGSGPDDCCNRGKLVSIHFVITVVQVYPESKIRLPKNL